MCRWMSRLTLQVVSVKIQRIKSIENAGALREGIRVSSERDGRRLFGVGGEGYASVPRTAFAILWQSLHGREAWDRNPEVVVIWYRALKSNIDAILGLAPGAPQIAQDAKRSARR